MTSPSSRAGGRLRRPPTKVRFAAELRAIQDSCRDGEDVTEDSKKPVAARCVERRCVLAPAADWSLLGATPPRAVDPGCVSQRLAASPSLMGMRARLVVKFFVSERGVPQAFSFIPKDGYGPLHLAVAKAVSSCNWTPGTVDGKFAPIWILLPLSFQE